MGQGIQKNGPSKICGRQPLKQLRKHHHAINKSGPTIKKINIYLSLAFAMPNIVLKTFKITLTSFIWYS